MKTLAIVAAAFLLVPACSSDNGSGNTGGAAGGGQGGGTGGSSGQVNTGGSSAGTGGAGTGGSGTGGSGTGGSGTGGSATGSGGATGAGGASDGGSVTEGGTSGAGGMGVPDGSIDATTRDAVADAIAVRDGAVAANGSYVRTGWTAAYTCTGTCLVGNGDTPGDMPLDALDGNYQTRWSTDRFQQDFVTANQFPLFFTVDMKQVMNVSRITTHPGCRDQVDTPGQLDVLVSIDGTTFTPVATNHRPAAAPGNEMCPPTGNVVATDSVPFPTTPARFIQIRATQSLRTVRPTAADKFWAIGELNVFP